jgi:serine/threonine protein kinase/Tol biopolymer transport system component
MAFSAGARLGAYEILGPLGAGGMGEVWQARDTRLGRDVALKVLPDGLAQNADRLARFRREAHLLASLNHPNIAAIHGLEEAEGKPFLALELVRGEDLLVRLSRGAIPVAEALEIARQIVGALEEAHAKGIVHRDLKPGNIKLTPEGKVKVLDFGLAKAYGDERTAGSSGADVSHSPTLALSGTLAGAILGTAPYMSPEQASGKALDRRTDIWSFGVVLFEMLTGQRLFTGETASEVLASVIKEEPRWEWLPAGCPPAVIRLLRRCLRKRPAERLQDIGDARLELDDALQGVSEGSESTSAVASRALRQSSRRERWAWACALLAATIAAVASYRHRTETRQDSVPARFGIDLPAAFLLDPLGPNLPAVSPDGRNIAFGLQSSTGAVRTRLLFVHSLVSGETRSLAGSENGRYPFWSPDGGSLAFFAGDQLSRMELATGTMRPIAAVPSRTGGGTWNRSGTILFHVGGPSAQIYSVRADGGEAAALMPLDEKRGEVGHFWPQFLPDGRHFLFTVQGSKPENTGVFVAAVDSPNERRRIVPGATRAVATNGHLLFSRDGALLAQPFDPERALIGHEATALAQSLAFGQISRFWTWFSSSPAGTVAYVTVSGSDESQLTWIDRRGARVGAVGRPGRYGQLALSPDEREVAVEIADDKGQNDLWILDVALGKPTRVTTDPAGEFDPVWLPDGRSLVFGSDRGGDKNLFLKNLQGNEPEALFLESVKEVYPESWSPDGKTLLYLVEDQRTPRFKKSAWSLSSKPGAKPELLLRNGFDVDEPQVSPDGRWLAYESDDSGQWEVYIQPFRRPGARVPVSVDGGGQPKWRRDGRELFYLSADSRVMSVAIKQDALKLDVGVPVALFETGSFRPGYDDYAPSGDGQRFLVKVPKERRTLQMRVLLDLPAIVPSTSP